MFSLVKAIDQPKKIKELLPLTEEQKTIKRMRDLEVAKIIRGESDKILLIIGPCSADNENAVLDYIGKLSEVAKQIQEKVFIVPRIYTNKPRTRGEGYKGMLHQPDPEKETDIQNGLISLRRLHLRALQEFSMSSADDMLYPENHYYVDDLISYVAVGARSVENQQHRLVASGIGMPTGMKNPMNGSVHVLLNSIHAAQIPNEFKFNFWQVKTDGNPLAHAILRGAVDTNGINIPNYHYEDVVKFTALYEQSGLKNPAIIIDTNHSNSGKNPFEQIRIVKEVLANKKASMAFGKFVKGFMIESYLKDGNQDIDGKEYGMSITDACLGWEKTEKLLYYIAENS
ncbi:MAG TPA: 3-deoxy-7-phosphoheptulonate synthase [Clostridia bacterium]